MSDTIVDPPLQPTMPDVPVDDAAARRRRHARIVAGAIVTLVATLAVAGALVYFFLLRFVPTAARHVPANASVVARIEVQQIATYEPVRKHLWSLLFEPSKHAADKDKQAPKPLAKRIDEHTGIDLRTDIREVMIASVDASAWLAILGGRLRRGKFVGGMQALARDEGWAGWHRDGDVLVGPGVALAQADDGTLLVGTDEALVRAALPASDDGGRLAPPLQGAVAFALTKQAWSGASRALAALQHGWTLAHVERMSGRFILGDHPAIEARFEPSSGTDPGALAADIESVVGELRLAMLLAPDVAGEKEALAGAKVRAEPGRVVVEAPWPKEGLERGCARLATLLR